MMTAWLLPPLMLVASNIFMMFAWYGHLRYPNTPLFYAIFFSWLIALFEYCLAVPANRLGVQVYNFAQLKAMQEIITLMIFCGFSLLYLKQPVTINQVIGFVFIAAGAWFLFKR